MKIARQKVEHEKTGSTSKNFKDIMFQRRLSLREKRQEIDKNTIVYASAAREAYSQLKNNRGFREGNQAGSSF